MNADERIKQLEAEVAHWKANHASEVRRARILKERPDMPIERVRAFERWGEHQQQLAASQAREVQLREALEVAGRNMDTAHEYDRERDDLSCAVFSGGECDCHVGVVNEALRVLTLPHDTNALEAMIIKAGEVMRSQALLEFWCLLGAEVVDPYQVREKIRTLPVVTLEDLQK